MIYSFIFFSLRAVTKGRNWGVDDGILGFALVSFPWTARKCIVAQYLQVIALMQWSLVFVAITEGAGIAMPWDASASSLRVGKVRFVVRMVIQHPTRQHADIHDKARCCIPGIDHRNHWLDTMLRGRIHARNHNNAQ